MKKIYLILFLVIILSNNYSLVIAGEKDLPEPPKGYTWKWCESMQAGFLMPKDWYFKEEGKGETRAIFISKESIELEGRFKAGLSVNAVKNAAITTGSLPSEHAKKSFENMKSALQHSDIHPVGDGVYFKGYAGIFRSRSPELGIVVQYTSFLGNDMTGTLYVIVFESPEADWNEAWKIGKPIIDNLAFESEY